MRAVTPDLMNHQTTSHDGWQVHFHEPAVSSEPVQVIRNDSDVVSVQRPDQCIVMLLRRLQP